MLRIEFIEQIAEMATCVQSDIDDYTADIYWKKFENYDLDVFKLAMRELQDTESRFPSVAKIKAAYAKHNHARNQAKPPEQRYSQTKRICNGGDDVLGPGAFADYLRKNHPELLERAGIINEN